MNEKENAGIISGPVHIGDAINRTMDIIEKGQILCFGIPSGFPLLDRFTHGWQEGELVLIGGRPAIGKTTLALSMARNAAVDFGVPTAYFSLEMSSVQLTKRLIVSESSVPVDKVNGTSKVYGEDWQRMERALSGLSEAPLYIDDTSALSTMEFDMRVKDLVENHGVRLVFVDYLHLMDRDHSKSSEEEDDRIIRDLKKTAQSTGTTIIAISYVKRPTRRNYVRPVLSDLLFYCPSAAEYADRILLLNRPSFLGLTDDYGPKDLLELNLVKNNIGDIALVNMYLDTERLRVVEDIETKG